MPFSFSDIFTALMGSAPFPWQSALYEHLSTADLPAVADIPTGLGKTSIVAIWLIAVAQHPDRVPRRLVYVVNRRTVVDQTTTEVVKLRGQLAAHPGLASIVDSLRSLGAIPLPDSPPLAVSTLCGQFADNREWSADPARPAVIIGTVDMVGSGLLFSRYTVGFKVRPHHAAFLAQDALIVHDEAHLEPAFQKLLETLVAEQARASDPRKLRAIALTATSRGENESGNPPFGLTEADKQSRIEDGVERNLVLRRIQPPETHIAWREDVDVVAGDLANAYPPEELLEDFPLKPRELLRDTSERIFDRLSKIAENLSQDGWKIPSGWLVHEDGWVEIFPLKNLLVSEEQEASDASTDDVDDEAGDENNTDASAGAKAVKDAAKRRKERLVARLANCTLILPPSFGGLSAQGFLSDENSVENANPHLDIADANDRKRVWSETPSIPAEHATAFRLVRIIDTQLDREDLSDGENNDGNDTDATAAGTPDARYWLWLEAKNTAGAERRFAANAAQPETLSAHTTAVVGHARAIAE